MSNSISVCIITKNEEKNIARCIESVKPIAEEIIVVDTGSEDRTVEIAKRHGAIVDFFPWNNNFSDARNKTLDIATKEWILFLDADEALDSDDTLKLKSLLLNADKEAYLLKLTNIIDDQYYNISLVLRLFKNKPEYRFKGKIHEQVINSIIERHGNESIGQLNVRIFHYGYDPKHTNIDLKAERNLKIMASYEEHEKDGYYYYALGNEYARTNNQEKAMEAYTEGLKTNFYEANFYTYLVFNTVRALHTLKRYQEALDFIKKYSMIYTDFKDLFFFEALCHIECKRFSKAKMCFEKYFKANPEVGRYPSNNLEQIFNLNEIMSKVNEAMVPNAENISVIIEMEEENDNIIKSIASINEIASEVFVVSNGVIKNRESIVELGAKPISFNNKGKSSTDLVLKKTSYPWIFIMKSNEICSHESQKKLVKLLNETKEKYFYVGISKDMELKTMKKELRLFNKLNGKIIDIKRFELKLKKMNKKIEDSDIILYELKY